MSICTTGCRSSNPGPESGRSTQEESLPVASVDLGIHHGRALRLGSRRCMAGRYHHSSQRTLSPTHMREMHFLLGMAGCKIV